MYKLEYSPPPGWGEISSWLGKKIKWGRMEGEGKRKGKEWWEGKGREEGKLDGKKEEGREKGREKEKLEERQRKAREKGREGKGRERREKGGKA